jgi:RNA-binding protein NOB1
MQWSNRGNRFSVPKPVHGAANQRVVGGGKSGWGNDLILSEDQKEYVRALSEEKRQKKKDIMDPDSLPGILSGDRSKALSRPKVGAGRNVNSKKR